MLSRLPMATRSAATQCRAASSEVQATSKPIYKNVGPEPKAFSIGDGSIVEIATASANLLFRPTSLMCSGYKLSVVETQEGQYGPFKALGRQIKETSTVASLPRPAQPLELYEFETCPFCKKVREAMTILDLDVIMRPCPKDGDVWRPEAIARGGKKQFPYLVDPNTGKEMYESDDIIKYLFTTYGDGTVPSSLTGTLAAITCGLGLAPRFGKGGNAVPSVQPAQPLVLYGYEPSPFVKVVREALCEAQIPYLYRNAGRGSPKREEVYAKYGHFQVPLLEDPNTESYLFESSAIIRYLKHQYGVKDKE